MVAHDIMAASLLFITDRVEYYNAEGADWPGFGDRVLASLVHHFLSF